jgi:hypothetical protein
LRFGDEPRVRIRAIAVGGRSQPRGAETPRVRRGASAL